ncbi:ABC transporter substrate-binding protein [Gordonia sp. ABSL1-1]|uniref:ABC transporter substrate-binding protein n=1 Tax=Gordonia sp. ABSL1-1 TaxID=3053923 RepID=UPI0025727E72|nr:ABC transporter substrate-binding protein [Gordonia sp. ABSL1-1]MDL9936578.1 ABC transporter substrate-binding protein [Gordonia sp. ABSL1-1]
MLALGGLTACADDSSDNDVTANAGSTTELPNNPATGEPIKIGFISAEGGAVDVPSVREGGEAAVQYLNNNAGGIGGHKVELVVCKQHEEPTSATKCAQQMVAAKVAAVVSPMGAQGAVMLPIVTGAGIPYIAQAPVSQAEMAAPNSFMLSGGIVAALGGQAQVAARDGVKKVTVLVGDTGDAGAALKALGGMLFKRAGVELDVVTIPLSVADPTPQIQAALAGKPGAVSILGDGRQCISALKVLQTAAPDVAKYLISACLDHKVVEAVGADAVAGGKAFTTVAIGSDDPSVVLYRSVIAKYAPNTDPAGLAYMGYQVMVALGEVGKSLTGPVTPKAVADAFKQATDVPLPAAPGITFSCNGTAFPPLPALCSRAILVSDVTDTGKLENATVVNN